MDIQLQKQFKILVIGDSCDDIYHYGDCKRISQEAPVPIFRHTRSEKFGGMAKNVVNNLKGLGNEVDLLTNSKKIKKERFIDEFSMQHLLRFDKGEHKKVSPISKKTIKSIEFASYDAIVISDYDKGFLDAGSISDIVNISNINNIDIFVDSKKRDLSLYKGCIIKINESEFRNASSIPESCEIIITTGSSGAVWNKKIYPAARSEIDDLINASHVSLRRANVCGAGDTFLSGFISKYIRCKSIDESIKFANICASKAIENFGTYVISLEDIL